MIPVGWGPEPREDDDPWALKLYRCGDLRALEQPERGSRVVAEQFRVSPDRGRSGPDGKFLAQCWCGRTCAEVTPELVRAGDTVVCSYPRCAEIAAMSPAKRVKLRPRNRSLTRSHAAAPVAANQTETPRFRPTAATVTAGCGVGLVPGTRPAPNRYPAGPTGLGANPL